MKPLQLLAPVILALGAALAMAAALSSIGAAAPNAPLRLNSAGSVSLTAIGTTATENFDSMVTSGTSNSATLARGWEYFETGTNANITYTAGTGSSVTGDTYSFGVTGTNSLSERAFGELSSGSLTSTLGANFANNTGQIINSLAITYTGEQWRYGGSNRNSYDILDFQYSTDAISLTSGTWTDVNALDFTSVITTGATGIALDGNAAANRQPGIAATITGLSIANGGTFWIRWLPTNITGNDDGMATDDFQITPLQDTNATPTATATATGTQTPDGTATATGTPSPTSTSTQTPTSTATPTATNTPGSITATPTASPTATATPVRQRGDCNADNAVNSADVSGLVLEIFDGDGANPNAVPGGTFAGDPIGCNANADAIVDAGDLTCVVRLIFGSGGGCGP